MTPRRTTWLALALVLAAAPLAAQAPGLPIRAGGILQGLELAGTVGFTGADSRTGDGTGYAASVAYGINRLGLTGSLGAVSRASGGGSDVTWGALASVRLIGGELQTFAMTAYGGYGYFKQPPYDPELLAQYAPPGPGEFGSGYFPVGLDFSLTIPTPVVSIRPWLSPRYEFESVERASGSESESTLGGSAGVDLRFVRGFGLRLLWDKLDGRDQTIGLGAAYHF